jgi:hypothetical protein
MNYDGPPAHKKQAHIRLVAVQRAVQSLVSAKRVSLGVAHTVGFAPSAPMTPKQGLRLRS